MQKRPPSAVQIAVMVAFTLTCFGILLYVWRSFGGPIPLAPKGYQVVAGFEEATSLSDTADVRISGVSVGRVVKLSEGGGRTQATMQIDPRYAPIPRDTRAILRLKTLLGETYVELTPGDPRSGSLPDGGRIPNTQIASTTELDEVTRALDTRTRQDLQHFVHGLSVGLAGRGQDLNYALGNLPALTDSGTTLLRTLDSQQRAVRKLISDSGVVFGALGRRQGEIAGLIQAGDRVLSTTAARDRDLADTVRILPVTLAELRPTLEQVRLLSGEAGPVVHDLRPGARALGPALQDVAVLSPQLEGLFGDVDRVIAASRRGVPALTRIVRAAHPLLRLLVPVLREAQPVVDYLALYKEELVSQLAGVAAASQASTASGAATPLHYLRVVAPFTSEGAVAYSKRLGSNRHNPYFLPLELSRMSAGNTGLRAFDCSNVDNPGFEPAPPCLVSPPLLFRGRATHYPHVRKDR
ncbi:MAG: MCE family protein [Actinobacteria bacterium]|nr:MCE family protein [Actinomycetota bacterium]